MSQSLKLYYAAGAKEVWLCDEEGRMALFSAESEGPVEVTVMCPEFPRVISVD